MDTFPRNVGQASTINLVESFDNVNSLYGKRCVSCGIDKRSEAWDEFWGNDELTSDPPGKQSLYAGEPVHRAACLC
jgi:hypothetical protein